MRNIATTLVSHKGFIMPKDGSFRKPVICICVNVYARVQMLTNCPYCASDEYSSLGAQVDRAGARRTIALCQCGLSYPLPRMNQHESLAWLESNYQKTENAALVNRVDYRPYLHALSFLGKHWFGPHSRALDIGAFDGTACVALETLGFEAFGLEPYKLAVEKANERGRKVFLGNFPEEVPTDILQKQFDLVIMFESVYYMTDLRATLQLIRKLLRPGGMLLLKFLQARSRYWENSDTTYFMRYGENVQSFPTRESVTGMLVSNGFDVAKVKGYNYGWPLVERMRMAVASRPDRWLILGRTNAR